NNGSVANMWDLLTPPAARPTRFTLGSREYDVKTLGYRSTPDPKAPAPPWEYNTSDTGNSNAGHVYGTTLPDADKRAMIEFLKQLRPGDIKREPLHSAYCPAARHNIPSPRAALWFNLHIEVNASWLLTRPGTFRAASHGWRCLEWRRPARWWLP